MTNAAPRLTKERNLAGARTRSSTSHCCARGEILLRVERNQKPSRRVELNPMTLQYQSLNEFGEPDHRFNKAQQDAFLPHIERGVIVFVGATTENPSFELNSALLSRCRVHVMDAVGADDIVVALRRALADKDRGLGALSLQVDDEALSLMA